jgi:hypothetical protein
MHQQAQLAFATSPSSAFCAVSQWQRQGRAAKQAATLFSGTTNAYGLQIVVCLHKKASHRRPSRTSAAAAAAAGDAGGAAGQPDAQQSQPSNEELLARLRTHGVQALCSSSPDAPENPRNLTMDFLFWLSAR